MPITAEVQIASTATTVPQEPDIQTWVAAAIEAVNNDSVSSSTSADAEVSIRIVDEDESQTLNRDYRQQDKPTNVLSFPAELNAIIDLPLLGDLVICAPIVAREAQQQHKHLNAHWAHMVIHGTLHLLGYDHIDDDEATHMEALETTVLATLGFAAPYA